MTIDKNALDAKVGILHLTISIETELECISDCVKDVLERLEEWPLCIDIEDATVTTR